MKKLFEKMKSIDSNIKNSFNWNEWGMATYTDDKELINNEFKKMKKLFEKMKSIDSNIKILSIGMSDDYSLAIKNGSNMIRVGSKIFGKRNY
jgi:hypothetical protein